MTSTFLTTGENDEEAVRTNDDNDLQLALLAYDVLIFRSRNSPGLADPGHSRGTAANWPGLLPFWAGLRFPCGLTSASAMS